MSGSRFVGLQQRLLSSIAAFARTLEVHRKGLVRTDFAGSDAAAEAFVHGGAETEDEPIEEDGEKLIQDEEDAGGRGSRGHCCRRFRPRPRRRDARDRQEARAPAGSRASTWLAEWVRANMAPDGRWNDRRLVLFTEYEDTRRWVEKRLAEALDDLQAG